MRHAISVLFLIFITPSVSGQLALPSSNYVCPPCGQDCDVDKYDEPGMCSHCNMLLVKEDQSKTIAFYLQDGVEVLDFAGPMEVFSYAGYKVFTVSNTKNSIKSQGILTVVPDYTLENAPAADILAFFGGNSSAAFGDSKVIDWVKKQNDIQYYFSVCTGAFVLAEAGILDGNTATTFHDSLDELERSYPKVDVRRNVRFVDNGNVITTAGISAGIDGALHLVAKLQGFNKAKRTAYYMEYDNWVPGDGLLLTSDDPYKTRINSEQLLKYQGTYEYKDDTKLELVYNQQTSELQAVIGEMIYPIYHEFKEVFSDATGRPVFFISDDQGKIKGFTTEQDGHVFKKLK